MADFTPHPEYDKLPEAIRGDVTEKEFAWMTDWQRERLTDDFCCPEPDEEEGE